MTTYRLKIIKFVLFLMALCITITPEPSLLRAQSDSVSTAAGLSALMIVDCQGFTRAVQETNPGINSRVEVTVSSPNAQPVEMTLKEVGTEVVHHTVAENGVAVFENIPAGTFEISAVGEGIQIGTISLSSIALEASVAAAVGVGAGIGAGGVATGAVIGVEKAVESIEGGGSDPDPTPTPTPVPTMPPPTPTPPCATCDPDATPPPLDQDDFFPTEPLTLSPSS